MRTWMSVRMPFTPVRFGVASGGRSRRNVRRIETRPRTPEQRRGDWRKLGYLFGYALLVVPLFTYTTNWLYPPATVAVGATLIIGGALVGIVYGCVAGARGD